MFQPNEIYTKYIYPKNFSISAGWQYSIASIDNNTSKKKKIFFMWASESQYKSKVY